MTELPTVPVSLRVHLAHATLQAIAEECGADVLHIKGPAVDPSLRPTGRSSVDADVLVRPAHLRRFLDALRRSGWQEVTRLETRGLIEHSVNWYHGELGQADIHVRFPGFQTSAENSFDQLWLRRTTLEIAHSTCSVPTLEAQWLIQLLHSARTTETHAIAIQAAWTQANGDTRDRVRSLARRLDAEVALAAATGDLDAYRRRPEFSLWRYYSGGMANSDVTAAILAHAKAAPAGTDCVRLRTLGYALSLFLQKPTRLRAELTREPTAAEVFLAYRTMIRRVALELLGKMRR